MVDVNVRDATEGERWWPMRRLFRHQLHENSGGEAQAAQRSQAAYGEGIRKSLAVEGFAGRDMSRWTGQSALAAGMPSGYLCASPWGGSFAPEWRRAHES